MKYYIYAHRNLSTNAIFYIGHGKHTENIKHEKHLRAYSAKSRSKLWRNIVTEHGVLVDIIEERITKSIIQERKERYGCRDLKITNMVDALYSAYVGLNTEK